MMRLEFEDPRRCLTCGSHVTPEFRRGYGDQDDRAHRCYECDTIERLERGSATGREVDLTDPLEEPERFAGSYDDLPVGVRAACAEVAADGGERVD